ncbi:hypothetical protein LH464_21290 [Neorhizobium sp. T786]|uniref:hypothetical protein n=1 Tax=Pseudorhizobium xiangyangii TaxID=2883104 RepID=UPI001D000A7B|nr:hypothetical protein [Neorhizobium xiangyangii]MCB5205004.1 hypothetical protein [Neorhizobium xiangyangii]
MYEAQLNPISNRADWIETIELVDDDTGEVITDLTGVTAVVEVRSRAPCYRHLGGTTEDGRIIIADGGIIQWRFTAQEMRGLSPGPYEIGFTITRDGITEQELIGSLPVVDGVVR